MIFLEIFYLQSSLYRLLAKAGVKVSPNELAARASPTAPRRSDLPKLDSSLLHNMQQQQFPLPASMPPASVAAVGKMIKIIHSTSFERYEVNVMNMCCKLVI